jgi:hypothetical protein
MSRPLPLSSSSLLFFSLLLLSSPLLCADLAPWLSTNKRTGKWSNVTVPLLGSELGQVSATDGERFWLVGTAGTVYELNSAKSSTTVYRLGVVSSLSTSQVTMGVFR